MTCVVGLVERGRIYMGADSASVGNLALIIRADPKVFVVGPYLMGFTTSWRMGDLLRYRLKPPAPPDDPFDLRGFMVGEFVEAVRTCLREGGFASKHDERESGGNFLVGVRGRLFEIESDYQVGQPLDPFAAVGCGGQIALGAMHVNRGYPKKRIEQALAAAEHFSAGVRGPFTVLSL